MAKLLSFLLIYAIFIAVIKADGLSDISNNLASDLGPLLSLFGDGITRQYLSESIGFLDYFIFAMAPIGIIGTITAVIRICGSSSLRAFIGRAQEGEGTTEAELATSTSADVCELFNQSGITRVLGRPDIVELIYTPNGPADKKFHLFTKYLATPLDDGYWRKEDFSGSGHALFSKITSFFISKKDASSEDSGPTNFAPKPNLSLNVGVIRRPDWVFYVVAVIGFILQAGIIVFAGTAVLILGWNIQESDGEVATQTYAPGIFIAGTILLCLGVWGCAALIGQTTTETYYQRKSTSSPDVLYWVQPGPQVIGDQFFYSFAYSDAYKVNQRNRIWMSSTKSFNGKKPETLTSIAVLLVLFGYVGQFIGLRGLNAWISITQLAITLVMSILRSFLRMERLNKNDNRLNGQHDLAAGHELDWLAFNVAGREFQQKEEGSLSDQLPERDESEKYQKEIRWYIIGYHNGATESQSSSTEDSNHGSSPILNGGERVNANWLTTLGSQLLQNRVCLSNLTGHPDHSEETKDNPPWKDERVRVRAKARYLGAALCTAAAALLQNQRTTDEVDLKVKFGISHKDTDCNGLISIKMKPPTGPGQINWTLDTSHLEAVLGLWLWSMATGEHDAGTYNQVGDNNMNTTIPTKRPDADIFRVISVCKERNGRDESIDADISLWLGSTNIKYTEQSLLLHTNRKHEYSLADNWSAGMKDNQEIWEIFGEREISQGTEPSTALDASLQKFCGWNLIHDALAKDASGQGLDDTPGQRNDNTSTTKTVNVKGFRVKNKGHLLIEICAQELFVALLRSMEALKFREMGELTISESGGNIRLENALISDLTKCFVDNALGTYSDAISCLIPILRPRMPNYHEALLSALTQAATKYRQKGEWQSAENILRWGCQYYHSLSRSDQYTTTFIKVLRELCELYRWSLAQSEDNERRKFGTKGISRIPLEFPAVEELEATELVRLYERVAMGVLMETLGRVFKRAAGGATEIWKGAKFAFFAALTQGRRENALVSLCFMRIVDVISPSPSSWLPLAARNGWDEIVSALLEMKSSPDSKDTEGRTAVSHCAERDWKPLLHQFIRIGADLNLADQLQMTPLMYAAKNGHQGAVKLLFETYRLDINKKTYNGRNALWFATDQNQPEIMEYLLDNGTNINEEDDNGDIPLDVAVKRGHKAAVQVLLAQGSRALTTQSVIHPLIWAAWRGNTEIMKLLLENKAFSSRFEPQSMEAKELMERYPNLQPLRNHSVGLCSTTDIRHPSGSADCDKQNIEFEPSYSSPPNIMIGISALNIRSNSGIEISWQANEVSENRFNLTRSNSKENCLSDKLSCEVRSSKAVWLEFGADEHNFQVGKCNLDSSEQISFPKAFKEDPNVILWFSGLRLPLKNTKKISLCAEPTNITTSGFDLAVGPGGGHSEGRFSVEWLAYSSETKVQSGNSAVGKACSQGLNQETRVEFRDIFQRTPRVFLALSGFTMKFGRKADIEVKITELDTGGFSWAGMSPSGDRVNKIDVNWVAFG